MDPQTREPSRLPLRGTVAAVGTVGGLVLLLSFDGGPLAPTDAAMAIATAEPQPTGGKSVATDTTTSGGAVAIVPTVFTGDAIETRWGDVQVEVTLEGADITEVVALVLPGDDRHSASISDYVEPILREEAIAADSAHVSVISGATYTARAYAASLQSALDQAGVADAAVGPEVEALAEAPGDHRAEDELASDPVAGEAVTGESVTGEPVTDEVVAGEVRTATGEAVAIRWGDVQVAVTVQGVDIIDVEALALPLDDLRSERLSSQAEPILREEAIAADSADVSVVSGATYTSKAYAASLQSALDQLGV